MLRPRAASADSSSSSWRACGSVIGVFWIVSTVTQPRRTTEVYDPPVLAGQQLWGACAGGFDARRGGHIVLTSTGHCTSEGTVAYDPDGATVRASARRAGCLVPVSGAPVRLVRPELHGGRPRSHPLGHLNVVDLARRAIGSSHRARGRSPARTSRSATSSRSTAATPTAGERWPRRARTCFRKTATTSRA